MSTPNDDVEYYRREWESACERERAAQHLREQAEARAEWAEQSAHARARQLEANWRCASCGYGNMAERDECHNCDGTKAKSVVVNGQRPLPEQLAQLRRDVTGPPIFDSWSRQTVLDLFAELDASRRELAETVDMNRQLRAKLTKVMRERDEARVVSAST